MRRRSRRGLWSEQNANDDTRASAQYKADAREPALWREDALGQAVPLACRARQKAMPYAWRSARLRCTQRKSERAQAWPFHQGGYRRAQANACVATPVSVAG